MRRFTFLAIAIILLGWGSVRAGSINMDLEVGGTKYHVFVAMPAEKHEKYPLVIYHHGAGKQGLDKFELNKVVQHLAKAGYMAWAPERGAVDLSQSILIANAALRQALRDPQVDPERIAVVGFSQGSAATFLAFAASKDVKCLCLCGFGAGRGRDQLDAKIRATDFSKVQPLIFIQAGEKDTEAPPEGSAFVEKALTDAKKGVKRIVYPGLGHDDLCGDKKYLDDMIAWLDENLLPRADPPPEGK